MVLETKLLPTVLKPDFDLFGLDVRKNGTLPDQLLAPERAGLWTLGIDSLESFDLLGGVPDILSGIEVFVYATPTAALSVMSHSHRHYFRPQNQANSNREIHKYK